MPRYREGQADNPNPNGSFLGKFFPSNVNELANVTQATALVTYCVFSNSSLQDMVKAVEQFPRLDRIRADDRAPLVIFSCLLRFIQGLAATIVTVLLILTTPDVVEIILNFTAVNYISNMDEVAFTLAKEGKYGPRLEKEAKSIEKRIVPYSLYRKHGHKRHAYLVLPISVAMIIVFVVVMYLQFSPTYWLTQKLRVQFRDPALHPYSGCYDLSEISHARRKNYDGHGNSDTLDERPAVFGYCRAERHWLLFTPKDNVTNPCDIDSEHQHVVSADTGTYDIGSSFDEPWFTATGEPLDLYFTEFKEGEDLHCEAFLYDGNCDTVFNDMQHQYDGGDCCASTCPKTNCGVGGVNTTFGVKERPGNGYPNCKNTDLFFPVTILLTSIVSSRNEAFMNVTDANMEYYAGERGIDFRTEPPNPAYLRVDCNETNNPKQINYLSVYIENNSTDSMENQTETVWVPQGATCEISVSNTTNSVNKWDITPIWFTNFTVYHGDGRVNEIISGDSSKKRSVMFRRIPDCYFEKLKNFVNLTSAYAFDDPESKALQWLVEDNDESGHSKCDDPLLIERAALSAMNFAAPISNADTTQTADTLWIKAQPQCVWNQIACDADGSVTALSIKFMNLAGSIPAAIGLLPGLQRIDYDHNALTGTIPSELGSLTNLKSLDIDKNALNGSIPTEFGNLKKLVELDLDVNNLQGTIPTEFGLLLDLQDIDIKHNQLSGTLPTEIGNLLKMVTMYWHNNAMTGSLPSQLGKLSKLEQLQLNDNKFTGSIPTEIGTMINMLVLDLKSNQFLGTLPTEIGNLLDMTTLSLTNNSMTGPLPTQLGELSKLEHLHLGDNAFTGSIPTEIGSMKSLACINLRGNDLRGPIPSEIGLMTDLTEIMFEGNDFTGTIPVEVTSLERLQLLTFGGSLTGDIPGNVRTLVPCVLCTGTSYKLKNISDTSPYPSASDCDILLENQQDTKTPFSGDDCKVLNEACIDCTVPDNLNA